MYTFKSNWLKCSFETAEEVLFAATVDTSWTELHVGVRMHHELHGMIFSDYSFGVGVPFFSTNSRDPIQ